MQPEINQEVGRFASLQKVTPLSKYLAMALFIIMPFIGGWIGYSYAPEKIIEVERIVSRESDQKGQIINDTSEAITQNQNDELTTLGTGWSNYSNEDFSIQYPLDRDWIYNDDDYVLSGGVYFGTIQSRSGGFIWGVWKSNGDLETRISQQGSQFSDRKEVRKNITINGIPALLVSVSSEKVQGGWVSNLVYIDGANVNRPGRIYSIGDGATNEPGFEQFYNSFRFKN